MNMADVQHLDSQSPVHAGLRGVDLRDVAMARHVSWRAGGIADRVYKPADRDDLAFFIRSLPAGTPVLMLGLGSNLLVREGGYRGTVVLLHGVLGAVAIDPAQANVGVLRFEAGVACPKVARFAAMHGLEGAEFLAGIPGTMGGALAMNAGCYGAQTWDRIERVTLLDRNGLWVERDPAAFEVGYRHVALRSPAAVLGETEWFIEASMRLDVGDGERSRARIKAFLSRRIATQPLQQPNAGSVFRNPPGDHAARLIESCGLKGLAIGGAEVSRRHANFIVNRGGATATDIESLICEVRLRVHTQSGVDLVPEVRIVGEPA